MRYKQVLFAVFFAVLSLPVFSLPALAHSGPASSASHLLEHWVIGLLVISSVLAFVGFAQRSSGGNKNIAMDR